MIQIAFEWTAPACNQYKLAHLQLSLKLLSAWRDSSLVKGISIHLGLPAVVPRHWAKFYTKCTWNSSRTTPVFSPAYIMHVGPTSLQYRISFDVESKSFDVATDPIQTMPPIMLWILLGENSAHYTMDKVHVYASVWLASPVKNTVFVLPKTSMKEGTFSSDFVPTWTLIPTMTWVGCSRLPTSMENPEGLVLAM